MATKDEIQNIKNLKTNENIEKIASIMATLDSDKGGLG